MLKINMTVNGKAASAEIAANTLLSTFLREHLRLTGTHIGCDTSQCGACVVHVNGDSVKSCSMLAAQADGADVRTIEGMEAADNTLHATQEAFRDCHGLQCGFCTPGMVMSIADLLAKNPDPTEAEIRHWLEGNLCRCTGYHNIIRAARQAAARLSAAS